ncbi:MAG: WG repeat-containing protein, partial [Coprothermobacterota bacterium]|nr:WG repeat-containing protein [Coprothermobacterota bacterium]
MKELQRGKFMRYLNSGQPKRFGVLSYNHVKRASKEILPSSSFSKRYKILIFIILPAILIIAILSTFFLIFQPQENLFPVKMNGKFGFINQTGKLVIKPQFDNVVVFSEGMAPVNIGGKWGFIDSKGNMVIRPQFGHVLWGFSEGLALVMTEIPLKIEGIGANLRFIDQKGNMVITPQLDDAMDFSEGLAAVKVGGL